MIILVSVTVCVSEDIRWENVLVIYKGVVRVFNIMHHVVSTFAFPKTQIFFNYTQCLQHMLNFLYIYVYSSSNSICVNVHTAITDSNTV
jgi:hypothetical protein